MTGTLGFGREPSVSFSLPKERKVTKGKKTTETALAPIENVELVDEMRSAYESFSSTANVRAIPDIRDGLKPVQRRILWAIHKMGNKPTSPMIKSMQVVGETMGKYHPFGDAGIYDGLATITATPPDEGKPFRRLVPFLEGQGNWGTLTLKPASARYTECRISETGQYMLGIHQGSAVSEISEDTVDMLLNYSQTLYEPDVLPALYPSFVVNGAEGIGAPATTMAPSHNLREVMNLAIKLVDTPNPRWDTIKKIMPGPDLAADCDIYVEEEDGVPGYYRTGSGSFIMRARFEVDKKKKTINVVGLPFRVSPERVIKGIEAQIAKGELPPDLKAANYSDAKGVHIEIQVGKKSNVDDILNRLLYLGNRREGTGLQVPYSVTSTAIVDGRIQTVPTVEAVRHWILFRKRAVLRRSAFRKKKAENRLEIVLGNLKAVPIAKEIIDLVRESEDRTEAEAEMIKRWAFTERQATSILDMSINQITKLGISRFKKEKKELEAVISHCSNILDKPEVLNKELKSEISEVRDKLKAPRRSTIIYEDSTVAKPETPAVKAPPVPLVLSKSPTGWVRASRRTPRVLQVGTDQFTEFHRTSDQEMLEAVSNLGNHYRIPVSDMPNQAVKVSSMFQNLKPGEKIIGSFLSSEEGGPDVMMVTNTGRVKRLLHEGYDFSHKRSFSTIPLDKKKNEKVAFAFPVSRCQKVALVSDHGYVSIMEDKAISAKKGRAAASMPGMRFSKKGEEVAWAGVVDDDSRLIYHVPGKDDVVGVLDFKDYKTVNRNVLGKRFGKTTDYQVDRASLVSTGDTLNWFDGIDSEPKSFDFSTMDRRRFPVVGTKPLMLNLEGIEEASAIWTPKPEEDEQD